VLLLGDPETIDAARTWHRPGDLAGGIDLEELSTAGNMLLWPRPQATNVRSSHIAWFAFGWDVLLWIGTATSRGNHRQSYIRSQRQSDPTVCEAAP
jgi:hypothetical protein